MSDVCQTYTTQIGVDKSDKRQTYKQVMSKQSGNRNERQHRNKFRGNLVNWLMENE